ncbi:CDP-diacylglycerol--glycerol-3-phosphate 3-phosphatidyltransferase [Demequina sp.]|uniref:CDP-diacylglycerol--glycerol-3-phosphate 3-phosphatidyltransferase n=1 Tax=Demequina sp. TaxID=2050685 RepID=UPI0025C6CD86|nr:CDP-diacylglycerol--glycerol-3-phosphate 3-phosphatidyltransferase [Demequina sp.]
MLREVPNLLTVLRLIAVPVMLVCLVESGDSQAGWRWLGWGIFVFAAATDALDGYLARRWQAVTAFGKLADPLADKALVLAALGFLAFDHETPWWPIIIIAVREISVTVGRLAVARDVVIPASFGGKAKTALQVAAIFFLLLPTTAAWVDTLGWWLLLVSVVAAVVTGLDYGWRIFGVARRHRVAPPAPGSVVADSVDPSGNAG